MMTRFTLAGFLVLLTAGFSSAQYCPEPSGTTSTFNWMNDSWWVWVRPVVTQAAVHIEVPSPFHPNIATSQPNTNHLHSDSRQGDYRPEDGWVLIKEEMGRTIPVRWPQFVLYNRFESKLRYFAYLTDIDGVDQIEVKVSFLKTLQFTHASALLEHAFTPMDVVENYQDKRIVLQVPNEFYGQSGIWVMADIPIAYDPCACEYSSMVEIINNSVNYMSVNLNLNGGGDITQVIEGGTVKNSNNRFANVAGGITNGIAKGNSAYKAASELIGVGDKLLVNAANKRLTPEIKNTLLANGFSNASIALDIDDIRDLYQSSQSNSIDPELKDAISWLFPKKVTSVVPDWIKNAIPFANTAFALFDFIVGGGKSTPPKPMHFQAKFQFEGTGEITDESYRVSLAFRVPGSKPPANGAPVYYPNYDKVLGVLNLVEQPVMYYVAQSQPGELLYNFSDYPANIDVYDWRYTLKLSSPLKYALNPASGLELSEIRGAFYFADCPGGEVPNVPVCTPPADLGLIEDEPGVWRTPYMPLSCLENYSLVFSPGVYDLYGATVFPNSDLQFTDIQLHLVAKLSSPVGGETAWAARYRVHTTPAPYTFENTPPNPYLDVQEYVEVDNIQEIIGKNIRSWSPIVVTNDIVVTRGPVEDFLNSLTPQSVSIYDPAAPTYYIPEFYPGQLIPAPFTVSRMPNCGSNPPMSAADLAAICQNQMRYNPILSLSRPLEEEIAESEDKPVLPLNAPGAALSPNPVRDQAWLDYHVTEEGPVSIFVSDHAGRRVLNLQAQQQHAEGAYRTIIPANELPAGIYFVSVVRHTGVETLKLLKQ